MGKKTSEKTDDNLSEFKVGDRVKVNMHRGRIVEAEIKAVVEKTHGVRLQVSFGTCSANLKNQVDSPTTRYPMPGRSRPQGQHEVHPQPAPGAKVARIPRR
jgi:hypothetical protein